MQNQERVETAETLEEALGFSGGGVLSENSS